MAAPETASNKTNNTLSADPSRSNRAAEAGKTTMAAGEWNTAKESIPCRAWEAEGQKSYNNRKQGQDGNSPRGGRLSRSSAGSYRGAGRRGGGAPRS